MTHDLTLYSEQRGNHILVTLLGILDEDANLQQMSGGQRGRMLILLHGMTSVNSCGIRERIHVTRLLAQECRLEFGDVSVVLVHQNSRILSTRGKGMVVSSFAPYLCIRCNQARYVLLDPLKYPEQFGVVDTVGSPRQLYATCGEGIELNDIPDQYFCFLESQVRDGSQA